MKYLLAVVMVASAFGQQTVSLRVTGHLQSRATGASNFGHLSKQYRVADWTVSTDPPTAIKVPIEWIIQKIQGKIPAGVAVLSPNSSQSVVEDAQGRTALSTFTRVGTSVLGGFAMCEGTHVCPTGGSWGKVVTGAEGFALLLGIIPSFLCHAVRSITGMMPNPVTLDAENLYTQPGMIIVELGKHVAEPGPLDETTQVTIPGNRRHS